MPDNSHFTQDDREILHEVKDKQEEIPHEVKDYMTDRLNEFTLQLSEHIAQTIEGSVKHTVNGKIDKLTNIVEAHIQASKPSMDFIDDIQGANRVVQFIVKLIGAFGVAVAFIYSFIRYLKT